jgi:hypothetical protein
MVPSVDSLDIPLCQNLSGRMTPNFGNVFDPGLFELLFDLTEGTRTEPGFDHDQGIFVKITYQR